MFKLVKSKKDFEIFNQIWADFCEESGILFLNYNKDSNRYLILNDDENEIGTIEIGEYKADVSNVEKMFPFSTSEKLHAIANTTVHEVSKLTVDQRYRGNGFFKRTIALMAIHAVEKEVNWYIGIVNPRVYKYVRSMGFEIYPIGDSLLLSDRIQGIPFILNAKHGVKHLFSFSELRLLYEAHRMKTG